MNKLSIIIPVYNEEECLKEFYDELIVELNNNKIKFELLFIDDGSLDCSLNIIKELSKINKNVFYYSFSRNFGKEAAMYCGLKYAKGDYVVIMDADLQHPPYVLVEMYKSILNTKKDSIVAVRKKKCDVITKTFYFFISKISKIRFVDGETDFRIMSRRMINSVLEVSERKRFSKGIFNWVGFDKIYYKYDDVKRLYGKSKWNFCSLLRYALDGIISFSNLFLYLPFYVSFILFILNILLFILLLINYTKFKIIIFIISLLFMLLFFMMGLFGIYIDSIIIEVKNRPLYFIKDTNKKN